MRRFSRLIGILIFGAIMVVAMSASCSAGQGPRISPGQKERLKTFAAQTRNRAERVRDEMMRARTDMFQAYRNYNLDERKAKAGMERLSKAQLDMLNMHLDNEIALRYILNQEQFAEFSDHMGKRMGGFGPPEEGSGGLLPGRDMLSRLDLSKDQIQRIKGTFDPGREMMQIVEKLRRNSKQLIDLYAQYNLDTTTAKKLIGSIHDSQQQITDQHHKFEIALRQILDEDQFNRLRELMAEKFKNRPQKGRFRKF